MEPPKSAAGQMVAGGLVLGAAAWVGATLNSRAVALVSPKNASIAAATGAATGGLVALFGATALAITNTKWKALGATTAILGAGGFAALALVSLKASDRLLRSANAWTQQPQALLAGEADSGGTFSLRVGDTLTVELPASQPGGEHWSWALGPAGALEGPVTAQVTVDGGVVERDTFTAASAGAVQMTASLVPAAGGAASATWTGTATVTT
jgi:hypothetical protein